MKNKSLTRRRFVKTTAIGTAGAAFAANGFIPVYSNVLQDAEKPAILGGTPVRPGGSGLGGSWPVYDDTDVQKYLDAFKSKKWSEYSNSPKELSVQFEKEFAQLMGTNFCAVTNSGTDALDTAQRALDIGPGD